MTRLYGLLLAGLLGYIVYPYVPPRFLGLKPVTSIDAVVESSTQPAEKAIVPEKVIPKEEKDEVVQSKRIGSRSMAKKDDLPTIAEEPDEPEVKVKELDGHDFSRIITNGVETGNYINFRKDNIISWKLKEQAMILKGSQYEGEVSVELGTLFGAEQRRAHLVIKDEKIADWKWLEGDKKK